MEKHKRFLVFTYDRFYPDGGLNDFMESFDTIEEAKEWLTLRHWDGWNIYDRIEGVEIE